MHAQTAGNKELIMTKSVHEESRPQSLHGL
jgi:hypothetical protein